MTSSTSAKAILAVLPSYRSSFLDEVHRLAVDRGLDIQFVAGDSQLDTTVKSFAHPHVKMVRNRFFMKNRILWQSGGLKLARGTDTIIADLNPRSATAWALLVKARMSRQRILLWGHVSPRKGPGAKTAPVRRLMRNLADGVISYTWADADIVRAETGGDRVWVAANGLYTAEEMGWEGESVRNRVLYVGRLEPNKKPRLLLDGFATALPEMPSDTRLTFVGEGSEVPTLKQRARELGVSERVDFLGFLDNPETLRGLYNEALVSVSPGYVGLSLTQSLGFGVPMLVADNEPHAPEVELLNGATGAYFRAGDVAHLAHSLSDFARSQTMWDRDAIVDSVRKTYSSTAMADGFCRAVVGIRQEVVR